MRAKPVLMSIEILAHRYVLFIIPIIFLTIYLYIFLCLHLYFQLSQREDTELNKLMETLEMQNQEVDGDDEDDANE